MDILPLNGPERAASLAAAVRILRRGGIVVVPTETAYAMAADGANARAVARVRRLKGRGAKPIALIAASTAMVRRDFAVDPLSARLMRRHWPGALTLVLAARDRHLRQSGLSPDGRIGVRVSDAAAARLLARRLGRPIVATSANRSGRPACYALAEFLLQFRGRRPDAFLDAGRLPKRRPSTVALVRDGRVRILRAGPVVPRP